MKFREKETCLGWLVEFGAGLGAGGERERERGESWMWRVNSIFTEENR